MAKDKSLNKEKGERGELLAAEFLEKKGNEIVIRNFKGSSKQEEIDIVFKEKNAKQGKETEFLVFCEVKFRTSRRYGNPEVAVGIAKQKQIFKATDCYLNLFPWKGEIRFDIISIVEWVEKTENDENDDKRNLQIHHIKDAFYPLVK